MDYLNKIVALSEHIEKHPSDYQSVISLYKMRSKAIEAEIKELQIQELREVARCRQILKERSEDGKEEN